ncbi:MAG: LysR family transcriptional regulator [Ancylobacter novellus]|uniref:LysR family transcriptional regulator n=1 Tax=Ancylobacter novellus TaxID=921 RepID=A0A2W5K0W2_ANCNO|nr:MAG: LysR family transcriptional regulator [Ancylobacter novellus]
MTEENPLAVDTRFARSVDWNLFGLFVEIVRSGSVSAAARSLNRTQPSLSASLRRFEESLGVQLCDRTARGIKLTPAGQIVHQLAEEMYARVRIAPVATANLAGQLTGSIRICMISDFVSPTFDRATVNFNVNHPGVAMRLDISPWRAVVRSIETGDADVGVACDSAPSAALRYEPFLTETQQLYCGSTHRLFGSEPTDPSAFADEHFVLTGRDEPEELTVYRRRYGLGVRVSGATETLNEARRLIDLGIGIGFLPTGVAESIPGPTLWPLLPAADLPSYTVYIISRPLDALEEATRELLRTINAQR